MKNRIKILIGLSLGFISVFPASTLPTPIENRAEPPIPKGFTLLGSEKIFGPPEQKLKNGTIFDYMDGGGLVYLEYGFKELHHKEFSDQRKNRITLDIYTFSDADKALAALNDEKIAPSGGDVLKLNLPNKSFRYPPDYFVYLASGCRLIYLHITNDHLADVLNRFASNVLNSIKEELK